MKVFLTGRPGIGKTTIIKRFIEKYRDRAHGFWTEEIRDSRSGERTGFKVFTTQGDSAIFAKKGLDSPFRVGKYGVDLHNFESLVLKCLESLIEDLGKIVIMDEIGKMELFSVKFQKLVEDLVFVRKNLVLGTIPESNFHPLIRRIKSLNGARIILVNEKNRDSVIFTLENFFNK